MKRFWTEWPCLDLVDKRSVIRASRPSPFARPRNSAPGQPNLSNSCLKIRRAFCSAVSRRVWAWWFSFPELTRFHFCILTQLFQTGEVQVISAYDRPASRDASEREQQTITEPKP